MSLLDYISENWILILTLLGFTVSLLSAVFMDQKAISRMYALILEVFFLSVVVYIEFHVAGLTQYRLLRIILMAVRYSATPVLIAQVIYTVVKNQKWHVFIPAIVFAIINFISIFTGIVFSLDSENKLVRGPIGMMPFIAVGLYCIYLIYLLVKYGSLQRTEIVPVIFFAFAFISGILLPFIIGSEYAKVFCETIAVSMFVYYVFTILQLTKRDSLTGLLNRQAYYSDTNNEPENITALISVDMNGLKTINDQQGHVAGDEALTTLAKCFLKAVKKKHGVYRVGGDEFVIVCRRTSEESVKELCSRIHDAVAETRYSCSIGYGYADIGNKSIDELLKASDENMYAEKEKYYQKTGIRR